MDQLSVYLAIGSLIVERSILVLFPGSSIGPSFLLSLGARSVTVIEGDIAKSLDRENLEFAFSKIDDHSIGCVVCVESYIGRTEVDRVGLFRQIRRILSPHGFFALSLPSELPGALLSEACKPEFASFWKVEEELKTIFSQLHIFAQMPWQGYGFAPIDDDRDREQFQSSQNVVDVLEEMIVRPPEITQYIAVASDASAVRRTGRNLSHNVIVDTILTITFPPQFLRFR